MKGRYKRRREKKQMRPFRQDPGVFCGCLPESLTATTLSGRLRHQRIGVVAGVLVFAIVTVATVLGLQL